MLAQRVQRHASPQTHSHARITTLFFALPCAPVGCVHSLPTPPLCSVFPSSILMMYLSTHHVHTEVPHWPDESLCEVESCCQPEAYACLIPIASGHSGPPPRSTITCCISSPSAPPPLWFGKQRVRENHLSMGLHAQKRRSWQVTALAVHSPVGQAKQ